MSKSTAILILFALFAILASTLLNGCAMVAGGARGFQQGYSARQYREPSPYDQQASVQVRCWTRYYGAQAVTTCR